MDLIAENWTFFDWSFTNDINWNREAFNSYCCLFYWVVIRKIANAFIEACLCFQSGLLMVFYVNGKTNF